MKSLKHNYKFAESAPMKVTMKRKRNLSEIQDKEESNPLTMPVIIMSLALGVVIIGWLCIDHYLNK